jgi:hemolysin activation/secretion protein
MMVVSPRRPGVRRGAQALPVIALVAALIAGPECAHAQLPAQLPGPAQPGRPPERAAPVEIPQGQVELFIPAPRRAPEPLEVETIKFTVGDVAFDGMAVFQRQELAPLVDPLLNRDITLRDMLNLADAVEAKYRDAGYVLSRAVVPPQRIGDQVFHIQVIEGYIKSIVVEGGSPETRELIESVVQRIVAHRPARLADLERGLLLANDLPGVVAAGVIRPGGELGAADLVITVTERTWDALASVNNRNSRFAGRWSLYGEGSIYSALGLGEQITLGFATSPDFSESRYATFRYLQPLAYDGLSVGLEGSYSNGEPGFTLAALNAHSVSYRVGPRLAYPVIRSRSENLTIDSGIAFATVETDLLGQPFNREDYRVWDVRATYAVGGWFGGASALSAVLTRGLDFAGATPAGDPMVSRLGAVPDFTKVNGEAKHIQPLFDAFTGKVSAAVSAYGQYAFNTVYAAEGFALGGAKLGRGYDPAELIGDHGLGATNELRYDDTVSIPDFPYLSSYQLYGFYDVGQVWNRNAALLGPSHALSSAGAGIRLISSQGYTAGFEVAQPLTRGVSTEGFHKPTRFYVDLSIRF